MMSDPGHRASIKSHSSYPGLSLYTLSLRDEDRVFSKYAEVKASGIVRPLWEVIFWHGSYEYWCDGYTILPYHHPHSPIIGLKDIVTEGDPCLIVDSDEAKRLKDNLGFDYISNIAAAYEEDLQARNAKRRKAEQQGYIAGAADVHGFGFDEREYRDEKYRRPKIDRGSFYNNVPSQDPLAILADVQPFHQQIRDIENYPAMTEFPPFEPDPFSEYIFDFEIGEYEGRLLSAEKSAIVCEKAQHLLEQSELPLFEVCGSHDHVKMIPGILAVENVHFDDDEASDDDQSTDDDKASNNEGTSGEKEENCGLRYFLPAKELINKLNGIFERARNAYAKVPKVAAYIQPKASEDPTDEKQDDKVSETKATIDRDNGGSTKAENASTGLEAKDTGDKDAFAKGSQASKPDTSKPSQNQSGPQGRSRARTLEATHFKVMAKPGSEDVFHSEAETSSQPDQEKSAMQMPIASQFGGEDVDEGALELEQSQILPAEHRGLVENGLLRSDSGISMD
ncbi:MAG: hypothetical protein Q9204_001889 [Flavoplaca sp. TL-2023a]